MGKKSVYCSDEEEAVFEKAKELCGGSISPLINKLLKQYVQESEYRLANMEEISRFIGVKDHSLQQTNGEKIKFIGKFVGIEKDKIGPDHTQDVVLYYTKKGAFLVYFEDNECGTITSQYEVHKDMNALYGAGLPPSLISAAEKLCPEVPCRVLDI